MNKFTAFVFILCFITMGACSNKDSIATDETLSPEPIIATDSSSTENVVSQSAPPTNAPGMSDAIQKSQITPITFDPTSLAVISPSKYQPATAADAEEAAALISQYQKACDTNDAVLFFSIFTEKVRYGFSGRTQEQLTKYFSDSCMAFPDIATGFTNGATISPDSYSTEDDQHISNMCPRSDNGICKSGINVGIEDGKLKISEH